jgi:hypothetical protein
MDWKQGIRLALLSALTVPLFVSKPGNGEAQRKKEVDFSVSVTVTARTSYDEQSKHAGGYSLPSEVHETQNLSWTFRGAHRWTVDSNVSDNAIIMKQLGIDDFHVSGDGAGTETRKGGEIRLCPDGLHVQKEQKTASGEEVAWTYQILADPRVAMANAYKNVVGVTPDTLQSIVDTYMKGSVTIAPESSKPGQGEYFVSFPLGPMDLQITVKGTKTSWTKVCGKDETSTNPVESATFNDVEAGLEAVSAVKEAWKDEAFLAFLHGTWDARKNGFTDSRHFSFPHRPKTESINQGAEGDDSWIQSTRSKEAMVEVNYTLNFGEGPENEAVIIQPDSYASWVPEAGEDEEQPGNKIVVTARVHQKDKPDEPSRKKARFKFKLVDVSKEKGVCLNWPGKSRLKGGHDLKIDMADNLALEVAPDGQSAESKKGLSDSAITITSYDWGAYGKLQVTAVYDDGKEESAHLEGDKSRYALTIPKDDNRNHIADFWEESKSLGGNSNADGDEDSVPAGDNTPGDGLSLYEEYRGFRIQGGHVRTNPALKDLFIRDSSELGKGRFAESLLTTWLVDEDEFGWEEGETNPRVINFNRGFATRGPQHLLFLMNKKLDGGDLGFADGGPGPPKNVFIVWIDVACCKKFKDELACTIAHELAHGCNVWHHGDDYEISQWKDLLPDGTWSSWHSDGESKGVAAAGGTESGVEQCIMRYDMQNLYETPTGPILWQAPSGGSLRRGASYLPIEPPGTIFCVQSVGTGVNAPDRPGGAKAGNASVGKCLMQFHVNDSKPCKAHGG